MPRGRPRLPVGTYGSISTRSAPSSTKKRPRYIASVRFRDPDGITRPVTATGQTKTDAEYRLKIRLTQRQEEIRGSHVTSASTVTRLGQLWLDQTHDWVANTREAYSGTVSNHVNEQLGGLTLAELRPALVAAALIRVRGESGPGAAKLTKTVLAGMCDWAVEQGAINANPARVKVTIPRTAKKTPRALTVEQTEELCDRLRSDTEAVERYDLADLVEWMLGTGARIGEACAAREAPVVDLAHGTWEVNATLIRVKGAGLMIQPRPKTEAGWRRLALPSHLIEMVKRRQTELRFGTDERVVFPSPHDRALRDPRNTNRELRRVLDRLGYEWATSHTFRKTVASRLDEAGLTPREIADQLGHAKPSMTLDVYMGRKVVSARAAKALER